MPLEKVTPAQVLIQNIDEMIANLQLRRAEIVATMPQKKKEPKKKPGQRTIKHPLTGQIRYY